MIPKVAQKAKKGDILYWTIEDWRYKGVIIEVSRSGGFIRVDTKERWTPEHRVSQSQTIKSYGEKNVQYLTFDYLDDYDLDLTLRRTADIHITIRMTTEGREFTIWGEGDGIPNPDGTGGGLMYMNAEDV